MFDLHWTILIYALLGGLIPSLIWLFFWLREDTHSEPRSLLIACFIGGMISVIIAGYTEEYVATVVTDQNTMYTLWATIEELLKFIAVALIALRSTAYDEPIDAMIYCVTVALGFAALENALFILKVWHEQGDLAASILGGNMRFIGASLVHVVSSTAIGFGLGWSFYRGAVSKFIGLIAGLGAAVAIHAAFNLCIVNGGTDDTLKAFAWIWAAVVLLIVLFEEVKAIRPRITSLR